MGSDSRFLPASLQSLGFVGSVIRGSEVIVPPVCAIPAGAFLMGSDQERDSFAQRNELPQHTVTLSAFRIGKFPVTVAEYACAVRAKAVRAPETSSDLFEEEQWHNQLRKPDHPVQQVYHTDGLAYADWLAQMTGLAWRLPTEAEWEKAARGADGRVYPWGDAEDSRRANTGAMGYLFEDAQRMISGPGRTTPVGSYPSGASPYGPQDMSGNVWEWTSSLLSPYPYQANDGREDPQAHGNRVLRGGSYFDQIWAARAAYRGRLSAPASVYGFRIAYS